MTREQALKAIQDDIAEIAGIDLERVIESARFAEDLDIDSLSMVEVVVCAEEKFGIKIPDGDEQSFKTVGDLIDRAVAG